MRRVAQIAIGLVLLYALLAAVLFAVMRQPPAVFGKVMAKVPGVMFMVLPFKPLWLSARAGHLRVGDMAPDFALETLDHQSRAQLSSHRGQRPVVLVFGSYT